MEIVARMVKEFQLFIIKIMIISKFKYFKGIMRNRIFSGTRDSYNPRNRTFEVSREILIKNTEKGQNSHVI